MELFDFAYIFLSLKSKSLHALYEAFDSRLPVKMLILYETQRKKPELNNCVRINSS